MRRLKQAGHAVTLVLVIVVIGVVAGAGYLVWNRQQDNEEAAYTPPPAKACDGEWIDSHTHLDDMDFSRSVAERMRDHNVGCSVTFAHINLDDPEISMLKLREEFSPNPGRFILFADLIENDIRSITRQKLDNLVNKYPNTFKGMGEFAFYRQPFEGTSLMEEPWPTIFTFAAENDLFVMLHLTSKHEAELKTMLTKYPNTKVLLHHRELKAQLPDLLRAHNNLYYTLDATNLTSLPDGRMEKVIMFPPTSENEQQFVSQFDANRAKLMDSATKDWLDVFAAAPGRIMWGTDTALDWHTSPAVYKRNIDFSKEFGDKLPQQYREGYKFKNALDAFGPGVTMQNLSDEEFDKLDSAEEDE